MATFTTYVLVEKKESEFEVTNKIRTDVRGHYTYMLQGRTKLGNKANAVVNKSQYDKFDVPSEERVVTRKINRRTIQNNTLSKKRKERPLPKSRRKAYNEDIERWLAEHNGIDFDKLTGLDE